MTNTWRNRITRFADVPPDQLLANPANWRVHPKHQQEALAGIIAEVGYVDPVLVQDGTDLVIDGHLRVSLALRDRVPAIPVQYVDLDDAEAALVLATFDPITAMATADREQLRSLLDDVTTGEAALQSLLADLAEREGVVGFVDNVPEPGAGNYKEQYGVIVLCRDEAHQAEVYADLYAGGYECRVVTT